MQCQLCGGTFDPAHLACHTSCPLHQHCAVVCCPHCGYSSVDDSRSALVRVVRGVGGWFSPRKEG